MNYLNEDIDSLNKKLASGDLSADKLAKDTVANIKDTDKKLNAWITVLDDAKPAENLDYSKSKLAGIPIAIYFGDYIDNGPEDIMSTSFWRQVRDGALAFAAQYNADGGDCTVVDLPKIGITGNSHFMFQELNNKEIADHIYQWLESRALA